MQGWSQWNTGIGDFGWSPCCPSGGLLSIQTFRCVDVSLLRAPVCSSQMEQIVHLCGLWIRKYSEGWWDGSFFGNCFEKWHLKAKQHKVHLYKQFSPLGIPPCRDKSSPNKEKNFQTSQQRKCIICVDMNQGGDLPAYSQSRDYLQA